MNIKKFISVFLVSFVIIFASFLFYEYKTEPLVTSTVPYDDARNVSGTMSPLAKNITIGYLGSSETIFLVLSASTYAKVSSGNYIIISTVKIQQSVKFPFSSITNSITNVSLDFNGSTYNFDVPSFSGSNSHKIAELYNAPFSMPGNYTVHYTIGVKPIVVMGFLHFSGNTKFVNFNSTLEIVK